MPVIKRSIHVAKKEHCCDDCGRWRIHPGDRYTRLFGMAERGDKAHELKICRFCKDPDAQQEEQKGAVTA